ncbi:MAG: hypothetical protein Q4B50_08385, partial [Bacillota bacterium]|nr:hypothetical protein [Bacillota bacterium]
DGNLAKRIADTEAKLQLALKKKSRLLKLVTLDSITATDFKAMSRAGTPKDNAVMESIFGWFKEFLHTDFFLLLPCQLKSCCFVLFLNSTTSGLLTNSSTKALSNLESNRAFHNLLFLSINY